MPKLEPSRSTQQPRVDSNHPILLGLLALIFVVIAVYFFGFRNTSRNDGTNNAQPPVSTMKPETAPEILPKTAPEIPPKTAPETPPKTAPETPPKTAVETPPKTAPAKPEMPTKDGSKIVKPNLPEVKQAPTKFPSSVTSEPTQSVPTPEKAQPPGSSVPDLNRMVNEALKR
jgi:type IV secretory pathway VirB10-like protein